jgi:hypothetical protein
MPNRDPTPRHFAVGRGTRANAELAQISKAVVFKVYDLEPVSGRARNRLRSKRMAPTGRDPAFLQREQQRPQSVVQPRHHGLFVEV